MTSSVGSVSCLHISDIHLSGVSSYDENRLARSLCASMPKLADRFGSPDFIVFSGDVAKTGSQREYQEATKFFEDILRATSLPKERLFVVPGNHDVDRHKSTGLSRTLNSRSEADRLFCGDPVPQIANRQINFKEWYEEFFEDKREFFVNTTVHAPITTEINGQKFALWCLNSAGFSFDEHDQGKLMIGQRCLEEALQKHKNDEPLLNIAVMHHPIFWLSEIERSSVKAILQENFDLVMHGHLHETNIEAVVGESAGLIIAAAGATYQGSEWPNTAHFLQFLGESLGSGPIDLV